MLERFQSGEFIGETLWIGNAGQLALVVSFVMAGMASLTFLLAERNRKNKVAFASWLNFARKAFYIHGVSVIAVFVLLFIMILTHKFEYHYAWRHSSTDLPLKYIISSFWEGQEGSFLLWQFWHAILGFLLIRWSKDWEAPVMSIVSFTQLLLGSMVLGVYVLEYKIGVSPFVLLRNEMADAPIFQNPNYLEFIQDGNGLNPLLQNYWMVIHPPVLFLGFASTVIPFAYVIASMLRRDYKTFIKPALTWSLFSAGILGLGILMGGAWAYESLSFGGFWAWDPVENASLVPWIMLVAGIHGLVAYKATGRGLGLSYLLLLLTFILILVSTFLTRSGVLGDTSVHSFTDLGMTGQLLIYLFALSVPAIGLWIYNLFTIPKVAGEEAFLSREFWMFVGSLVFVLAGVHIMHGTTLPITNKWFGFEFAISDAGPYYNKVQIFFGIFIAIGAAVIQYFSYKTGKLTKYFKYLALSLIGSLLLAFFIGKAMQINVFIPYEIKGGEFKFLSTYWMLLWAGCFTVLSNLLYIILVYGSKPLQWAGSITHIGFGLMLVGILISQYKQEVISINTLNMSYGEGFTDEDNRDNILLYKGETVRMGDYEVVYRGVENLPPNKYYLVDYKRLDESGKVLETFTLKPKAQINEQMGGLLPDPSTRHYWHKDVFTHVSSVPNEEVEPSLDQIELSVGDTFFTSRHYVILESIVPNPVNDSVNFNETVIGLGAQLHAYSFDGDDLEFMPIYVIDLANGNQVKSIPAKVPVMGLSTSIVKVNPQEEKLTLVFEESDPQGDFIIMKAIIFPWINILWLGCIVMTFGFLLSMFKRLVGF